MTLHIVYPEMKRGRTLSLTPREVEILYLMAKEKCSQDIAFNLKISKATVRSHKKNMYYKLDVNKSAGAVRRGFEMGILKFA